MSSVLLGPAFLVLLLPLPSFLLLVAVGNTHVEKGPYLSISAIISSLFPYHRFLACRIYQANSDLQHCVIAMFVMLVLMIAFFV